MNRTRECTYTTTFEGFNPFEAMTTGVRGVYRRRGGYYARITIKGKVIYLGDFATLEEATEARRKAEEKYFNTIKDGGSSPHTTMSQ
ncbi:hypothetical protein [Faecalibaculum rodentium]|uniref:hypothetical protein n=1 Tax=Faecalibaculum rodentium TaxID=1702221 RepID=UPI00272D4FA0|nr:hypothetical protein [Faecalibaculum rodentium]